MSQTTAAPLVLFAAEAERAGEARIGGKAAGLCRLQAAGLTVPPWLVVPAEVLAQHLADAGVTGEALAAGQAHLTLAPRLIAALEEALLRLGPGPYAVRSSMVGEDARAQSFAGQLETFLYQPDAAAVVASLVRAWASAYAPRVLTYRQRAGLADAPAVGVIIQRMVTGRVSGVLFTADPVAQRRDRMLLTATYGLCEGVVSGACDTDEYRYEAGRGEVDARVVVKETAIVPDPAGRGTHEEPVPEALRAARALTKAEVGAVCEAGGRLAEALGVPLDLEWTLAGDTVTFLQARPITSALPERSAAPTPAQAAAPLARTDGLRVVWDNSNIQESYCGVTTPLTFSFARGAYASVYEQFLRALAVPEETIVAYRPVFRNLLGLVRGRVYYNINNWYRLLLVMPGFGRNKEDMERMMGLDTSVDFIEGQALGLVDKARRAPGLAVTGVTMALRFRTLDRDVERFLAAFTQRHRQVDRRALAQASLAALLERRSWLEREMLGDWHTPIIADTFVMMRVGALRRLVEKAVGPGATPPLLGHLLGGEEGIQSTEPTRFLLRLAKQARGDAALARALAVGPAATTLERLRRDHPAFAARVDEYLERYGDRCIGELKLESISLREDPSFVIQTLRNYLPRADLDPDTLLARERAERTTAEATVERRLGLGSRRRFRTLAADARRGIKHRENTRLCRTLGFGLYRDLHRAVGQRLYEAGRLEQPRDVFYLTADEIQGFCDGTGVSADLGAVARVRRAELAGYEKTDLPHRFETRGAVHDPAAFTAAVARPIDRSARVLRGLGCYPGTVEAPAKIILSPRDDLALNGCILVTLRTDPGWAPLFVSADGILVERGSSLSHSAVLARELGIPAVVGVPGLLQVLRDGERIRMDGGQGTVERLEVTAP